MFDSAQEVDMLVILRAGYLAENSFCPGALGERLSNGCEHLTRHS